MNYGVIVLGLFCLLSPAWAGEASVIDASIEKLSTGSYRIDATVQHDDAGWGHYADRWEVLLPEGKVLDTRVLAHPHTPEPFTRSLLGVKIPAGVTKIDLRAHDSVHGYGGRIFHLDVPR